MNRLIYLDYLRGIAIFCVLITHFNGFFPGEIISSVMSSGARGVQLFFIVSGFTIGFFYLDKLKRREEFVLFVIKRFFRIAPLFYLALLVYLITKVTLLNDSVSMVDLICHVLFINAFYFDYTNSILGVEWSIAVEFVFYMFFAVIIYLSIGSMKKWLVIFSWLSIASYGIAFLFLPEYSDLLFLSPIFQFYNFFMGLCLVKYNNKTLKRYKNIVFPMCLVLVIILPLFIKSTVINTYLSSILFGIILLCLKNKGQLYFVKFFSTLGVYSFSIYLNHYLFVILSNYFEMIGFKAVGFIALSTLVTSYVTYKFIEVPCIKAGKYICLKYIGRNEMASGAA